MKRVHEFEKWAGRHPVVEAIACSALICAGVILFTLLAVLMMG